MTDVEAKTDPQAWVGALADPARRIAAFEALLALGGGARAAVRAGLGDGRWEVRRWCAYWLYRFAETGDFEALVSLARDPKGRVRHAALVALAQAPGLAGSDVVPLLLERACDDESLRVRRQAVLLLAWDRPHPDLEAFFAGVLDKESDARLRFYARLGIARSRARAATRSPEVAPC